MVLSDGCAQLRGVSLRKTIGGCLHYRSKVRGSISKCTDITLLTPSKEGTSATKLDWHRRIATSSFGLLCPINGMSWRESVGWHRVIPHNVIPRRIPLPPVRWRRARLKDGLDSFAFHRMMEGSPQGRVRFLRLL